MQQRPAGARLRSGVVVVVIINNSRFHGKSDFLFGNRRRAKEDCDDDDDEFPKGFIFLSVNLDARTLYKFLPAADGIDGERQEDRS